MGLGEGRKEAVGWWASIQEDRQAWGMGVEESPAHNFSFSLDLKLLHKWLSATIMIFLSLTWFYKGKP